jgi:hypothetical protein
MSSVAEDDGLEILARLPTLGAAEALRSFLASQGIEALVVSQDALRLSPLPRPDQAGVRVLVRAGDLEGARELLAQPGAESEEE